jgi:hypothetical protein
MVKSSFDELSNAERLSLVETANAALRKAGTPCTRFSWRGKRFHYGPIGWEQDGRPVGTYVISQGHGFIKRGDPLLATQHPFLV